MSERVDSHPKAKGKPKAPFVEVYEGFEVMEMPNHGCLVRVGGTVCFIPSAMAESFPVPQED